MRKLLQELLSGVSSLILDQRGEFSLNGLLGFWAFTDEEEGGGGGAFISSIENFSITLTSSTSGTATISSVDTSRSIVLSRGYTHNATSDDPLDTFPLLELTNATTVTATRGATGGTLVAYGTVIQFASGIVDSVQTGSITIDGSSTFSNTATISSVTTSRSVVFTSGYQGDNTTSSVESYYMGGVELTNATTVTAYREQASTNRNAIVGYSVVEFASGVVDSIQQLAISCSGETTNETITAVDLNNTWLVLGGPAPSVTSDPDMFVSAGLTSTTNVRVSAAPGESFQGTFYCTVLELASGYITSAQRGTIVLAQADTSNTATISSVNTSAAIVNYTGFATGGDEPDEAFQYIELTNATTVTTGRISSGSVSSDEGFIYYEVLEFAI